MIGPGEMRFAQLLQRSYGRLIGGGATLNILLASIYYSPEVTGNAPYAAGVAEHWARQGHSVKVLTGIPHYPQWRPAHFDRLPGANPTVLRYRHYIPRTHNAVSRLLYEGSWLLSAARGVASGAADVAVGITPTLSGAMLAALAGRRFKIPFGLIFQDLIGPAAQQSGYKGSRRVARYVGAAESAVARRAETVAIVADNFRVHLERTGVESDRIMRVRNWSHAVDAKESREEARRRLGWPEGVFICLHAGNMGHKQGLDNLLECAKLLSDDVRIVIAGDGNDRERLTAAARAQDIANIAFILTPQSGSQFTAMLRSSDVLILNQRSTVDDMSLPSKLAAYFAAERPVVAAVAQTSSAGHEIALAKAGIVVPPGEPGDLVRAIYNIRSTPELGQKLAANGKAYSVRYLTRTRALEEYDRFLRSLVDARTRAILPVAAR